MYLRRLHADAHPDVRRPGKLGESSSNRSDRLVRTWKICQSARRITSKVLTTNSTGTSLWNKSLMEFTKMVCGFFHFSGNSRAFSWSASSNPFDVVGLAHCFKPQGHPLGVAMLAPRTDLGAARQRVPRGFGPLNCRIRSHDLRCLVQQNPNGAALMRIDDVARGDRLA